MTEFIAYYGTMLLIRFLEEEIEDLFTQGRIKGTTHPAIGQEATAVGVAAALTATDLMTSTHRGHGHLIARGGDPKRIMAELFGRETGYSRGRGGSQLMADTGIGFLGANGITGGSLPTATGAALSARLRNTGQVVVCFFGDGAANQGTFHESLNLASIWKLPVIYVCENNMYAMSTPVQDAIAIADIADRAAGYGIPGVVVDGNDLLAVRQATAAAGDRARTMAGPSLLECKTYRLSGHSRGDQCKYRTRDEEQAARANDPIERFRRFLMAEHGLSEDQDHALREAAHEHVAEAIAFAEQSPYPDVATLEQGVYA